MPCKPSLAALAALALIAAASPLPATAQAGPGLATQPILPDQQEVAANFDRWAAALATGDPVTVTALFAPGAVLAPTVSNEVRTTPERIEAYFVDFLKLSPRPRIDQRTIVVLDQNTAVDAGVWTFDLTRDGVASQVTARFSFVWEKTDRGWQIQLLHSSLMPEGRR